MDNSTSELDYFSQLFSSAKQPRNGAVRGILKRIKQNAATSQHVVYLICKRLIRGLGGSNPTFRQGCFTSVVGFFSLLPTEFNVDLIEEIISNELNATGNDSKQEEGEAYLGQILAYGAMIVSDFLLNKSEEDQFKVFEKIFHLSKKRSYLHHVAFVFLSLFLKKIKKEQNPDGFIDHLKDLDTNALDILHYVLTLVDLSSKTHTIRKVFDTKKFYDLNNANKLAVIVKKNKSPKLFEHEFFDTFVNSVWKHPTFLVSFWNAFCDLKQNKDSFEGKIDKPHSYDLCVLNLSNKLFQKCKTENAGNLAIELFNRCFIDLLIKCAKREKKMVHSILTDFSDSVKLVDDETKISFLKNILFDGLLNFDTLTNSKTMITITNNLSFNGITELAELYKEVLDSKRELKDFESKNKGIIICLNFFTKLINNLACYEQTEWRLSQLIYLLKKGFFRQKENINRELRRQFQEAFLTSLGHRFPNLDCFHKVLQGIVNKMKVLLLKEEAAIVKFTDEMSEAWRNSVTLSEKMDKHLLKGGNKKEIVLVLKIILQYMSILLLQEPSTAINNIQDLQHIFEDSINEKDENIWIEVLIDLFLNLLSKPYYHHRHLIRSTFKSIVPHLTEKSFLQIVEVIKLSYDSQEIEDGENGSDDSDSSKDSDDDDNEEEMECSDEEISTNEKLRFELRNALGGGSDNESVDLDEMDEEEGRKLDETLSSIFKANIKRRKTDYLSKYQNQLAHFRTRVMDLIEMCTEVTLPLSYWLKVIVPLIELLSSTVGQNKLNCLRTRISCCLKKLNSARVAQDETSMDETVKVLENLLEKASKSSGIFADIKTELILVIKFILKSSKPFKKGLKPKQVEKNTIFMCYKNYLDDFFIGKNNLPVMLLTSLTSIGWDGMLVLIPDILRYSFDENVKSHKKLTGLKIIETFCKTPQYFDGHLEKYYDIYLPTIQELFTTSISKEIENAHSKEMNLKYFSDIFVLVNSIISRQKNSQLPMLINVEDIKKIIESSIQSSAFPVLKGKCKQHFLKLCNALSLNYSSKQENEINPAKSVSSPKSLLKRKRKNDTIVKKKKKIKRLSTNLNNE